MDHNNIEQQRFVNFKNDIIELLDQRLKEEEKKKQDKNLKLSREMDELRLRKIHNVIPYIPDIVQKI